MNDHILNVINQLLCYGDPGVTDSPHQRAFDHRLRMESIAVKNPYGNARDLAPGESFSIFSTTVSNSLSGSSTVEIKIVSAQDSVYRFKVTAGPSGFKTARTVTGISTCTVTVNNNAMATFDFVGSTLTALQVGDIMRVNGQAAHDTGPFAFNPINSGTWKIIGISGTKVYATREVGKAFEAVQETITSSVASDVSFFADDGIRPGMKFQITDTFSQVSWKTYEVLAATPYQIDFVSTAAIPEETGLTYISGSLVVYTSVKRLVYIEADQECSVRYNGATDDSNRITPIEAGSKFLRGFISKMGDTYSCEITNKSVNKCSIKFMTAE